MDTRENSKELTWRRRDFVDAAAVPLPPKVEYEWWYQLYFARERGQSCYDNCRREFSKLIWQLASPKWQFDNATFARSAAAFDNPDHVAIAIHNYRWRLDLADDEPKYANLERRLAEFRCRAPGKGRVPWPMLLK
jgi:hypothetical protein